MLICGLQKLTLLDYPGKVACTVFTGGCNFRCPFCHNASLVTGAFPDAVDEEEVFALFRKRAGVLDGVCITGGEPLLQKDIGEFLMRVKQLGYSVKLDTNGSFPERLKSLVREGLVDYVAMDIKNSKEKYALTAGTPVDIDAVGESVEFLLSGETEYEFRTTVAEQYHTVKNVEDIGGWIQGAKRYFIQSFKDSGDIISEGCSAVSRGTLEKMLAAARRFVPSAELRGVD